MTALVLALLGLAVLDSLNVLNIGVVSAIVYDSRLNRRSPVPGRLSYILGVFTVLTAFGIATVLGLSFLTELFDIEITPAFRYRGELAIGVVLIGLAFFPLVAQTSAPGWAMGPWERCGAGRGCWASSGSPSAWVRRPPRCPTSPAWR